LFSVVLRSSYATKESITEKSLQPIEQKEVEMYGDTVTAVRFQDGQVYVALRQMCEALGIDDRSQRHRF
jgi:hypothetical protein